MSTQPRIDVNSFQLYVFNLPADVSDKELFDAFHERSPHVVNAHCARDGAGVGRGYGFVQFDENEHAYKLASSLSSPFTPPITLKTNRLSVTEAYRTTRTEIQKGIDHLTNTTIFVGNLSFSAKDSDLRAAFARFGPVFGARVIDGKGFGFVSFAEHVSALAALCEMQNAEVLHQRIHCSWGHDRDAVGVSSIDTHSAYASAEHEKDDYYATMHPSFPKRKMDEEPNSEMSPDERAKLLKLALEALPTAPARRAEAAERELRNSQYIHRRMVDRLKLE